MLPVAVATAVVEGIMLYKKNQTISQLEAQNTELSKGFEKQMKEFEEKHSSLVTKLEKQKEDLIKLMKKNEEESKKEREKFKEERENLKEETKNLQELLDKTIKAEKEMGGKNQALIDKLGQRIRESMKQTEESEKRYKEAEERRQELMNKMEQERKELIERSEKEKENLKVLIQEMDEKSKKIIDKIEQEKKDLMEKFEGDKKELIERSNQEKQELRELIKKLDKDRNETQLVNQELLTKMNTILNLPSVNAAIQNLQGADNYSEQPVTENSQHSDTTATQGLHKTNGATQASNIATESSDELDDDIVVIPDPSSYIDEPMLSNYVSSNLSR